MGGCNLLWFRRDLRLEDNPALVAAAGAPGTFLPFFIWCPEEEGEFKPGRASRWWLKQSLVHLDASLNKIGSSLSFFRGEDSFSVLLRIARETGATQVFCNHLYDPISVLRDRRVKQGLLEHGIIVHTFNCDTLHEPWEIYDEEGQNFTTFQAFWKRCSSLPFAEQTPAFPRKKLAPYPGALQDSCPLEELQLEEDSERSSNDTLARTWSPGWMNAKKLLKEFLMEHLREYSTSRRIVEASTSHLSPHLHFGELSIRKLHSSALRENSPEFLRAIGLREYSRYVSFHFPFTEKYSLLLRNFPWRDDPELFTRWKLGRTGYPLVDAGMRELWATGWLHCKLRTLASSFMVKFLKLPWTWGMKYFWEALLDADLESDLLGWRFVAGFLRDGHQLHHIMDPQVEGSRLDPLGEYTRKWLPELARLPTEWIHQPWNAPGFVLRAAGVELGFSYPSPVIGAEVARVELEQALEVMRGMDESEMACRRKEGHGESKLTENFPEQTKHDSSSCDQLVPTATITPDSHRKNRSSE